MKKIQKLPEERHHHEKRQNGSSATSTKHILESGEPRPTGLSVAADLVEESLGLIKKAARG